MKNPILAVAWLAVVASWAAPAQTALLTNSQVNQLCGRLGELMEAGGGGHPRPAARRRAGDREHAAELHRAAHAAGRGGEQSSYSLIMNCVLTRPWPTRFPSRFRSRKPRRSNWPSCATTPRAWTPTSAPCSKAATTLLGAIPTLPISRVMPRRTISWGPPRGASRAWSSRRFHHRFRRLRTNISRTAIMWNRGIAGTDQRAVAPRIKRRRDRPPPGRGS